MKKVKKSIAALSILSVLAWAGICISCSDGDDSTGISEPLANQTQTKKDDPQQGNGQNGNGIGQHNV